MGCLLVSFALSAQKLSDIWSIETSLHFGRILRHTPNITIPITHNTLGGELSAECHLRRRVWHAWANYPRMGIAFSYQNFGDERIGQGFGLIPYVSMDFIRTRNENFKLYGRLGLGFGYLTRHYELPDNPDNNIVGSHFGNNTSLRLAAEIRLTAFWRLRPSFTFTHYSNAASQLPNFGINVVSMQLGLLYAPAYITRDSLIRRRSVLSVPYDAKRRAEHSRRWTASIQAAMGIRESQTYGGPKYAVAAASVEAGRFVSNIHRLRAGVEWEYIGSTHAFLQNLHIYTERESLWQSMRIAAMAGFEITWGRLSLGVGFGVYLTNNALQARRTYLRPTARYYFLTRPFSPTRNIAEPYILIGLKTHRIVAEYAFLGIGANF